MSKTAFQASRRSLFLLAPEDVVVVGLDTKDGPEHPLYDERIHMPLVEMTVRDIMKRGVIEPIVVIKNGEKAVVTDGRRRIMHAREVNRRLREAGSEELIRIPVLPPEKGSDSELMSLMIVLNEHREADMPINRAKKLQKFLRLGRSEEEAAEAFKISEAQVGKLLSLLDLIPEVQAMLAKGEISLGRAYEVAKLASDEQLEAATKKAAPKAQKAPSKAALRKLLKDNEGKLSSDFVLGIRYALGEIDTVPGL
jgi:ParB family transcriptional regulator, chromosome partitioning protein